MKEEGKMQGMERVGEMNLGVEWTLRKTQKKPIYEQF